MRQQRRIDSAVGELRSRKKRQKGRGERSLQEKDEKKPRKNNRSLGDLDEKGYWARGKTLLVGQRKRRLNKKRRKRIAKGESLGKGNGKKRNTCNEEDEVSWVFCSRAPGKGALERGRWKGDSGGGDRCTGVCRRCNKTRSRKASAEKKERKRGGTPGEENKRRDSLESLKRAGFEKVLKP